MRRLGGAATWGRSIRNQWLLRDRGQILASEPWMLRDGDGQVLAWGEEGEIVGVWDGLGVTGVGKEPGRGE